MVADLRDTERREIEADALALVQAVLNDDAEGQAAVLANCDQRRVSIALAEIMAALMRGVFPGDSLPAAMEFLRKVAHS